MAKRLWNHILGENFGFNYFWKYGPKIRFMRRFLDNFNILVALNEPRGVIRYVRKIFWRTNMSYPLIYARTCAYQGVKNICFLRNFAYVLNERSTVKTITVY